MCQGGCSMKKNFVLCSLLLCFAGQNLWAGRYSIDPVHSDVTFKIRHLVVSKVQGQFDKFYGEFIYDEKDVTTWKASATIETASINTRNGDRDKHLRSADFFDVDKYPFMTFKGARITDAHEGKAKLNGLLTIRGIEKPVVLELEIGGTVQDPWGNTRSGFEATTTINRKDFGIIWNKVLESGGLVVGEEVEISIHVEGIAQEKASPKPSQKK